MNAKKRKKRVWIIVLAIVVVIVAALGYMVIRFRNRVQAALESSYEVVDVTRDTLEVTVHGSGAVDSLEYETVYARISGQVDEVRIEDGDTVKAGDVIAVLDRQAFDDKISALETQIAEIDAAIRTLRVTEGSTTVKSPAAGIVKVIYAAEDDDIDTIVDEYGCLMMLSVDGRMKADITAANPRQYSVGQVLKAVIGDDEVDALVADIDEEARTITITVADDGYDADTPVTVADESGNSVGEGVLAINMPLPVTDIGGTVTTVYVDVGDSVKKNTNLIKREGSIPSAELKSQLDTRAGLEDDLMGAKADLADLIITAPMDGIVTGLAINEGETLQEGRALFTVQSRTWLKVEVDVDELDISTIQEGQTATVTLDALPDQEFAATVTGINPIGKSVNNVTRFTVTLTLDGSEDILIGMSASVDILAAVAQDALLIPVEAIQTVGNEQYVIMGADAGLIDVANHKVTTGLTDGTYIEILEGLTDGDTVVIPRKSVDGLAGMFAMGRRPDAQATGD